MKTRATLAALAVITLSVSLSTAQVDGIFETWEHAEGRTPALTYEEDRTVAGDEGRPETLAFRLSLYGEPAAGMPMLVQVHEWGGSFEREEGLASWIPYEYDLVMLYFQYKPSTGNEDDWWFGTHWDGECVMWAHQAVMAVVREAIATSLIADRLPGVTIDPNRVYLYGHSIGGTGAWQLGVRNPDVFAAVHAHSGFARFTPPVGPFQGQFEADIVGGPGDGIVLTGDDGLQYPARDYSNLAWWLQSYRDPSFETPFMAFTAGTADDTVPAASGGDLMLAVLDQQKRGFFYNRHAGGHSDDTFVQMNWLWSFRLDQSFLAFTNRVGYGAEPGGIGYVNDLYSLSWDPDSIVDQADHYEVQLLGAGTADVTLRRLQRFTVTPGASFTYWINGQSGQGTAVAADDYGLLTVPGVSGGQLLVVEPATSSQVVVGTAAELTAAVEAANAGGPRTILLQDGVYTLDNGLWVEADGVTVRSLSGDRNAVTVQGQGMSGGVSYIFNVAGSSFSARDMTLGRVGNHAVQIHGELDADQPRLANLRIIDTFEQMVKVSNEPSPRASSDGGIVEGCLFEYSAGIGPQYYIGGIDAHYARNWVVRDNTFVAIASPGNETAEHAVHFWSASEGTVVERNLIVNCDRGIGFGLGDSPHVGGIIRNNMISNDGSGGFSDVGIGLESTISAQVYNNTVLMQSAYPNAIEYRFAATSGLSITNNLTNRAVAGREGASADLASNVVNAEASWFVSPATGDLHLASQVAEAVDQGVPVAGLVDDFDRDPRPLGAGIDIGADELASGPTAPTAAFSWTPANPVAGESVSFVDESTGGPTSWSWSFGDGDTSSASDPSHTYDLPGTFTVTLAVTNAAGSDSVSRQVVVSEDGPPPVSDPGAYVYVIPASARTAGALGTSWVSDVVLNSSADTAVVTYLYFLEQGQDSSSAQGFEVQVPAGASVRLGDVVAGVFGRQDTSGAILIGADSPLVVTSRTYNDQGDAGTYGQFIEGYPGEQALTGSPARLVQLARTDGYRTNIGMVSVVDGPLTVEVAVYLGDGSWLGTESYRLRPFEYLQDNDIIAAFTAGAVDDAFAVVSSPTGGARFFAYASVIDNRTGDPVFIPARRSTWPPGR